MAEIRLEKKGKSLCWSYFGMLYKDGKIAEKNRYYCKICYENGKEHAYQDSASTTNLNKHLNQQHKEEIKEQENTSKISRFLTSSESGCSSQEITTEVHQKKVQLGAKKLLDICFNNFLSPELFENSEFRNVIKNRSKLSGEEFDIELAENDLLDQQYALIVERVSKKLSKIEDINICLNFWMYGCEKIFIETIVYLLDDKWQPEKSTLPIITLASDAGDDDMVDAVCNNLESFSLTDKVAIITSNCDIGLSKRLFGKEYSCFITKIQESYSKSCGQEIIDNAIKKVFKIFDIMQFFDDSYDDYKDNIAIIEEIQNKADLIKKMAEIRNLGRPNVESQSILYSFAVLQNILQCYLNNRHDITTILISMGKQEYCLEKTNLKFIEDIVMVSNVLNESLQILPLFPRLSLIPIVLNEISESLRSLKTGKISSASYKYMENFIEDLDGDSKMTDLLAAAMIVDPHTIKSQQLTDYLASKHIQLAEFLKSYLSVSPEETGANLEVSKSKTMGSCLASLIKKNLVSTNSCSPEINFLDYGCVDLEDTTVFDWWATNSTKYLQMGQMIRQNLPVSGSSTGTNIQNERQLDLIYKKSNLPNLHLKRMGFIFENYYNVQ